MVELRPLKEEDTSELQMWPAYAGGFEEMDYALREHGWVNEFQQKPDTSIYIVETYNTIVGFSLLSGTSEGVAEFRIAIHPNWIGRGMGKNITIATLKLGFLNLNIHIIPLLARKTNSPAAQLYESLGFGVIGESNHTIQG